MSNDSRIRFAAKGTGAFFVFLAPFLAASTYFGGGLVGIGISVALAAGVTGSLLVLWPKLRGKPASVPTQTPPPTTAVPPNTQISTELCNPGPYNVVYGDTVKIPLDVKAGDKIEGYVHEINNDFFDWVIVDEDEMVRFFESTRYRRVAGKKNVTVSKINCQVPHAGPYYLLLDIGSRLNDRQVEVVLRRSSYN